MKKELEKALKEKGNEKIEKGSILGLDFIWYCNQVGGDCLYCPVQYECRNN